MVIKEDIKNKLEFLDLNLEDLSKSLVDVKPTNFNISRLKDERDLKVYKYIPIDQIDILLTPHNKSVDLKTRYNDALPLFKYLNANTEDATDYARYLEFINLLKYLNTELIENIEKEQKEFLNTYPFEIRYSRSHMWDIYYDENNKRYFMLVCTKEGDFTEFFYLLKMKIQVDKIKDKINNYEIEKNKLKTEDKILKNKENRENKEKESKLNFTLDLKNSDTVNNEENSNNVNILEYFTEEEKDLTIENNKDSINFTKKEINEIKAKLKEYLIYAPIHYIPLSEKIISSNELLEIENYLWYFTKKWPITFDFYDNKNEYFLVIKGETSVFDRIESDYRFMLKNKEEAIRLYKHLKALFIIDSSTDRYFNFQPKIKKNFELKLAYENVEIGFDDIPDFIFKKYNEIYKEIEYLNDENKSKTIKLNMIKDDILKKEQIYKNKQNEIVQYLECKKSFAKKVKYYFKKSSRITKASPNKSQIKEEVRKKIEDARKEVEVDYSVINTAKSLEKKEFYTIDDFLFIYSLYEKIKRKVTDLTFDIRGLKLALLNINNKLVNVEVYLEEIDEHKKSIFDFWKFTNKDNKLSLEKAGIVDDSEKSDIIEEKRERVFNFDLDIQDIAESMDEVQRQKLSKPEINAIYLLDNGFNEYINMMKTKNIDEYSMISFLDDLKKEYKEQSPYTGEAFDIFGSTQPSIKTRYLKTNEFREVDRNKFKILSLNPSLDKFKFIEKLNENLQYINEAIHKIKTDIELPVYKVIPGIERIGQNKLEIFDIDAREELKNYKGVSNNINLIKINVPINSNAVFFTNIIYYENQNKTLPKGMDINTKLLLDLSQYKLEEKLRKKIVVNKYFDSQKNSKTFKNINIIEYDIITNKTKVER